MLLSHVFCTNKQSITATKEVQANFPSSMVAGAFASSYPSIFPHKNYQTSEIPCLVVCALDEDAYFEVARAIAGRLENAEPSVLHLKYVTSPQGLGLKMSSSVDSSVILMSDSYQQIWDKINLYLSNDDLQTSTELQNGRNVAEKNICFQYLSFFLEVSRALRVFHIN